MSLRRYGSPARDVKKQRTAETRSEQQTFGHRLQMPRACLVASVPILLGSIWLSVRIEAIANLSKPPTLRSTGAAAYGLVAAAR